MSNFSLNVKINGTDQAVSTIGEVEAALKATRQELKGVEVGSQAFEELANQARLLQNELKESFKQTTNFDQNLGRLSESVARLGSTTLASFSLISGSLLSFGQTSETVTEAQIKTQEALKLSLVATTIAINAQKIAGDVKLVTDRLSAGVTKVLTGLIGRDTIAKAANAAATGTATVAQRALNAAMSANPVLLLVTGIGLLVGALTLFSSSSKEASADTKDFSETINDLNDELDRQDKLLKEIIGNRKEIIRLQSIEDSIGKSEEEKLKIRIKLQEDLNELDLESLEQSIQITKQKIRNEFLLTDQFAILALERYNYSRTLQDTNQDRVLVGNQKQLASIRELYEGGQITVETYYQKLFELQKQEKLADQEDIKRVQGLFDQIDIITGKIEVLNKKRSVDEKVAEDDLAKQRKTNFDKRKAELDRFAKDQENTIKRLKDIEIKAIQDIERFRLNAEFDRTFDLVRRIEIIERLTEIELEAENKRIIEVADAQIKNIEKTIKSEEEKAKKIKEINDATTNALFQNNELALLRRSDQIQKEIELERKRSEEILQIEKGLQEEITFGNFDLNNRLESLNIRRKQLEIDNLNFIANSEKLKISLRKETLDKVFLLEKENLDLIESERKNKVEVERVLQLEEIKKTYQAKFGEEFFQTERGLKILAQLEENLNKEKQVKLLEIEQEFAQKRLEVERQLTQDKVALVQEFVDFATNSATTTLALFQAIADLTRTTRENELIDLRTANNERLNVINEQYNMELEAQQQALAQGLINQQQYNEAILALDTERTQAQAGLEQKLRDEELKAKKKAFEDEKKLRIASTIISGIQGALQAFAGAFQLGPIAGPIVGGILAGLVSATTAIQVAAIAKQKFDASGSVNITPPNPSGAGPIGGGNNIAAQGSAGGFTQFNESLVGPPTQSSGVNDPNAGSGGTRVYVLESDITATQNRVNVAETGATIG